MSGTKRKGQPTVAEMPIGSDRWMTSDRTWFERHPGVRFRFRKPMNGELGHAREHAGDEFTTVSGCQWMVVVGELQSGMRIRRFIGWPTEWVGKFEPTDEAFEDYIEGRCFLIPELDVRPVRRFKR